MSVPAWISQRPSFAVFTAAAMENPALYSMRDPRARLLHGEDSHVKSLVLAPVALNVFKGRNTLHRVSECRGPRERHVAVFSFFEPPGVMFTKEEQLGFHGRAA